MPLLPTGGYSAQLGQVPISGGRRATAEDDPTGAALSTLSHTASRAAQAYEIQVSQEESRKAQVDMSAERARVAKELDDAALSGADTTKIRETMLANFDKISEGFATKAGVSTVKIGASNAALMFDQQANAINVQRAFAQAKSDTSKLLNNESATVASNPSYLPFAIDNVAAMVGTYNIRPDQKQHIVDDLTKQLNMTSVLAQIRNGDPEAVKKQLAAGEFDLTPEQRNTAQGFAETAIRAERTNAAFLREEAKREFTERSEASADGYVKQIRDPSANKAGLTKSILNDETLERRTREHLLNFMDTYTRELASREKASDQETKRQLFLDITAPDTDPRKVVNSDKIFAAVSAGKLNTTDGNWLMSLVAGQKDENSRTIGSKMSGLSSGFQTVVNADPRLLALDAPQKAEVVNDYVGRVFEKVATARAANDVKGLRDLFDVNSKDYVGSAKFMRESIAFSRNKISDKLPKPVDLRAEPDRALELQVGQPYINSRGVPTVLSKEAHAAMRKEAKPSQTATGSISDVAAP